MTPKKEVIKHSAAVQIESNITLLQRRAWNVLLAHAYDELTTEERHRIRVHELAQTLEFGSKNEDYLKEALEALVGCKVKWNVLDKDDQLEWGVTTLLAEAKIKQGVCTYAYSPTLRERLHNPRMYARISLSMQNKFESRHAQALWEVCVDYLGAERDYGETPFIPLTAYRQLMGVEEDTYPQFKEFNRRVIKEPVEEINRVTDFQISADYARERRRVTAVKFRIRRMLQIPGETAQRTLPLFPEIEDMPTVVKELKETGLSTRDAWDLWQQGFGCVDEKARPEPGEDTEAAFARYIREKIHLLKRRQASGKVENSTGFLLEAIKKNYANPEFGEARQREEANAQARARQTNARERKALQEQRDQLTRAHGDALHAHCQAMIAASPALLEEAVAALQSDRMFRQSYRPHKTPAENYADRPILWITVDQYLERQYPDRFQALHAAHQAELAAFDVKIAALA